eukprot:248661_1
MIGSPLKCVSCRRSGKFPYPSRRLNGALKFAQPKQLSGVYIEPSSTATASSKTFGFFLQPDAQNPLRDVRLSLADLGFEGGRRADRQSGTMYYSFELAPAAQDDPIMLFEPTSLTLKTFADLDQAEWARAEETRKKAGDAAVGSGEQPEN